MVKLKNDDKTAVADNVFHCCLFYLVTIGYLSN